MKRLVIGSVGLLLAALVGAGVVATRHQGAGRGGEAEPSPPSVEAEAGPYRYIWSGTPGRQFTAREFHALARNDTLVIIQKGHGNSFRDWDAAARRLKSLNPRLTVLVNFLAGDVSSIFLSQWGSAFQSAWILRDENGNEMRDCSGGGGCRYRVDVSNPAYRGFVEKQVLKRLRAAPYDGVMYDNFHYYDAQRYPNLTPERIDQLNAGFNALITETRQKIGPNKLLFFNGVARNVGRFQLPDRGFNLLGTADGTQDEFFCYLDNDNVFRSASELTSDDAAYLQFASQHKVILESVKIESAASKADAAHIKRYCFGHYLMSYVPGYTHIQFREFDNEKVGPQIALNYAPEQTLDLGAPVGGFTQDGTILQRQFHSGWVFVNVGGTAQAITIPGSVRLWNGAVAGPVFQQGDTYSIPSTDAAYFLKTNIPTPVVTPSA